MTKILDWAEANAKPNLWALLLFALLLREGYQFHEIQKVSQHAGMFLVTSILVLFVAVAIRALVVQARRLLPEQNSSRGFTLIEIAIVLVVVGLIASTGLTFAGGRIDANNLALTKQRLAEVERALLGFVIVNGCLPCPADPADATSATAGTQLPNVTLCSATVCTRATGAVPWITLGLPEETSLDGWDRRFTYAIPDLFHNPPACPPTQSLIRCDNTLPVVPDASELVIEDTAGTIIAGGTTAAPVGNKNFAYAIVSHGSDGSFGFSQTGAQLADRYQQATGANGIGQHENGNITDRVFATGNVNGTNGVAHYDDIVVYRSAAALVLSCGSGSCGNP
jgi:prepilin-type N-terminal cleavage/methylation domain-containing protein